MRTPASITRKRPTSFLTLTPHRWVGQPQFSGGGRMAGVRKVARGHSRQARKTVLFTFGLFTFKFKVSVVLQIIIYQSKWSGLLYRTRCALQFAVTWLSLSKNNCIQHKPYQRWEKNIQLWARRPILWWLIVNMYKNVARPHALRASHFFHVSVFQTTIKSQRFFLCLPFECLPHRVCQRLTR